MSVLEIRKRKEMYYFEIHWVEAGMWEGVYSSVAFEVPRSKILEIYPEIDNFFYLGAISMKGVASGVYNEYLKYMYSMSILADKGYNEFISKVERRWEEELGEARYFSIERVPFLEKLVQSDNSIKEILKKTKLELCD